MSDTPQKTSGKVVIPEAILSYPHLFEAVAGPDGGEAKYSATFIFPEGTDLTALKAAAKAVGEAKWGLKFTEGVRSGKYHWPFRTDVEDKGYPKGSTYIGARSKQAPGLVSRYIDPATGKAHVITADEQKPGNVNELYAGCKVRASLSVFAFNFQNMKFGVSFGLNNIQKLGEGERLDSRRAATDEFEADLSEAPASLDDLM